MHRFRPPGFSIDSDIQREGAREHWIPLTDDGGDLRPRGRADEEAPSEEVVKEEA